MYTHITLCTLPVTCGKVSLISFLLLLLYPSSLFFKIWERGERRLRMWDETIFVTPASSVTASSPCLQSWFSPFQIIIFLHFAKVMIFLKPKSDHVTALKIDLSKGPELLTDESPGLQ